MNHRTSGSSLPIGKAIVGFINFKSAEGLSARTVDTYQRQLQQWQKYLKW
ncbi:hypothetical protein GW781_12310 [bacterium]|nr:hypothetical protein [bacterium]NCT21923.1 hypothetical protein [bacterium]